MAEHTITITFTPEKVASFSKARLKLCFATGFQNRDYNIIAWVESISETMTITWKDTYQISATKHSFVEGGMISSPAIPPQAVPPQSQFELRENWSTRIANYPFTEAESFLWANDTWDTVSVIMYQSIDGEFASVFISIRPVFQEEGEHLRPKSTVALWLEEDAEVGGMVVKSGADVTEVTVPAQGTWRGKWDGERFVVE